MQCTVEEHAKRGFPNVCFTCVCSVKQSVAAMEVCRRPKATLYDNLNQNNSVMMNNCLVSSSGNLTLTFNSHLNSITSQVRLRKPPQLVFYDEYS